MKAARAKALRLRADATVEQGFAQIAASCLTQVAGNQAGLVGGAEPEFVHQMRVGLRRLRSALSLFKPWITLPDALAKEMTWLGQALGAARDAEVLATSTLPKLLRAGADKQELLDLQPAAAAEAQRRRREAAAAVDSARYRRLILRLTRWLKSKGWRAASICPEGLSEPLAFASTRLLRRRLKKVKALTLVLQTQASAENRHALRIAVKKLRYASEFLSAFASAKARARLARLSALQELLGQLNDAEVAQRRLQALAQAQPALLEAAAFARGVLWTQTQQQIKALDPLLLTF
ncbi:MAG: CHAD domain-containing protein [Paucibacter sp.]|nr:CHAD domain-containing protein [Roseateles sp.]